MLAQRSDVDVRRLFTDQREQLSRNCDLFGISLSWELDGPILPQLLNSQNIPIWAVERSDDDPIVFGGGPVLTSNPEPLAPFLDVVLLGDGELLISDFIDKVQKCRKESRKERLRQLAKVPGLYIPALYAPRYNQEGKLLAVDPIEEHIPPLIEKQTWRGNTLSHSTVITPKAAWPDIHMVEVVRSCPELCRFCLASYLTLPFRAPSVDNSLIPAVEKGLSATKRLGLLGASVTQHPQFEELLQWLNKKRFENTRISISSVRAATVTPNLSSVLANRGSRSLTIAIESGSPRIREVINKKLSDEEIYAAARHSKQGGLKGLKLYGMVGLPTETEEDVNDTAELVLSLKKNTPGLNFTLGVSTFVPKAQTPFQWQGVKAESEKRLKYLAKRLKPKGISVRPESYGWSVIQALISRSDRRLAAVIAAVGEGRESMGNWKKTYKAALNGELEQIPGVKLPPPPPWKELIHDPWNYESILPWTHLRGPLSPERLRDHHDQSLKESPP